MSFDVHLIASSTSPAPAAFEALVDAALAHVGATGSVASEEILTHDGMVAELYASGGDGAMFALRGFSQSLADVIFAVAEATACFIVAADENPKAFRTPSNGGEAPTTEEDGFPPIVAIASATALAEALGNDFGSWSDYRDQIAPMGIHIAPGEPTQSSDQTAEAVSPQPTKPSSFFARLMAGLTGKR
jgi:hypothetical protein